jgi:hypothetical protein
MTKSRLTAGVYIFTAIFTSACLLTTWAYSQSPKPLKNPVNPFDAFTSQSADPNTPLPKEQKTAKPSRIAFEANWKNVQVSSKPVYFQQGNHAFVWTVKNTGDTPIELGDDYGFSIEPGDEDFIVGNRLILSVAGEKTTTVEVKASRVMTQSELTTGVQATTVPGQPYAPGSVPTYPANPTYSPGTGGPSAQKSKGSTFSQPDDDTFAPARLNHFQSPDTIGGREL